MTQMYDNNRLQQWNDIIDDAIKLRRQLHQSPELRWEEEQTATTIRNLLDKAGIAWRPCAGTGTIATLAPDATGRHIGLRGDIDGLPIKEQSGMDWSSQKDGLMHACGHDGHTATLIAAAQWLKANEDELSGPVSLIFQPAEEGGHGAREVIKDAGTAGVEEIYGWHNWPNFPFGSAVCPDGAVMGANGRFSVEITGSGGHSSQPDLCKDPVLAAAAITMNLQQIVSRRLPPHTPAVVSVTSIDAPSGRTVIPDTARLGGSIRAADTAVRDEMNRMIEEIVQDTARSYGVTAAVEAVPHYDATVNHAAQAAKMRQALQQEFGEQWQAAGQPMPIMASEDFSYYLNDIPGAFALVGANDGEAAHDEPCHSPRYDFNDRLIPIIVRIFSTLVGVTSPDINHSAHESYERSA